MKRIGIHSVPRSGSTWLGTIFDSHPQVIYKYQPLFSYKLKGFLTEDSSQEKIREFFKILETAEDDFMDQEEEKKRGIIPSFEKREEAEAVVYKEVRYHHILKNMLSKDHQIKVVGLVRNPLSTLHSWYNAPKEFNKKEWKFGEEWRKAPKKNKGKPEEFYGYEKWKEVALLFEELTSAFPDQFLLVRYDHLLENPISKTAEIFDFTGLEIEEQTKNFISNSRNRSMKDAYSVYRTKKTDDAWKGNINSEVVQYIHKDLYGSLLEKYIQ